MDLDALFAPLEAGPVVLPNRIASTSHQTGLVERHRPTSAFVAYHEARARGGVGLIVLEATAIHPTGLLTPRTLAGWGPDAVGDLARVRAAVARHGTRLGVQLFHGGREAFTVGTRAPTVAPSPVPSARLHTEPRALTLAEIEELIAGYAASAGNARAAGLDLVEINAGFSYLPGQFLHPQLNRREDRYGADRTRFLVEVLEAVREATAQELAISLRVTASSEPEGLPGDDAARVAGALADRGLVDLVSLALGSSASERGAAWIVPPPPLDASPAVAFARAARAATRTAPLLTTSRIADVGQAGELIATGVTDAVGMTRALIAEPELPFLARAGRLAEAERCIGCNQGCIGHYHDGEPIACTVNPRTGRESVAPPPDAGSPRRVVVVGGGPAGCAAARAAAGAGHDVVLLEAGGRLGGQWLLAENAPGHRTIAGGMLAALERWVAGADVRLGQRATPELVRELAPDLVVVATGATPVPLCIAGAITGWDALAGSPVGDRVVVWDWGAGWTGLLCAEALASRGHAVRLAHGGPQLGATIPQYQRTVILGRLHGAGVELVPHVEPEGFAGREVRLRHVFSGAPVRLVDVDSLVLCGGRRPVDDLAEPLHGMGIAVRRAGDCLSPRSAEEAVLEGTLAVADVPAVRESPLLVSGAS